MAPDFRRTPDTLGNSACGSSVNRCFVCLRVERDTQESVRNGLRLIRVRYGLPYSELPDLKPSDLNRFLLFLLQQGKERTSVAFPRRQSAQRDEDGLVSLTRLRRHERWELAQSLSSMKRNLPTSCSLHSPSMRASWEERAFSTPSPQSSEYLAFVKREVSQIFHAGWDRSYRSFVRRHVPRASKRLGGVRADLFWSGREEEFDTQCLEETAQPSSLFAEYAEVPTAGKKRPLLIFGPEVDILAGLHKCVYSHLRRTQSWLLCGPPTAERIASVCTHPHQTSVDLVSAADGLHHSVADVILDGIFFQSVSVPRSVRALAHASLRPVVIDKKGEILGRVSHGQMMGAYLSFPLLCLQSYFAARWAARFSGDANYLVNGDDCVISSLRPVGSYPPGFLLNKEKTILAESVVEVNSTTFLKRSGRWREIRHLRRGAFTSGWLGLHHASAAVSFSRRWTDAFVRCRFGSKWGFLPSQIGLRSDSYSAFQRQSTMTRKRLHTALPGCPLLVDESLRPLAPGEERDDRASEALRSHLMLHGRKVGERAAERWTPKSIGSVRRTYSYRKLRQDWRSCSGARPAFGSRLTFRPSDARAWCSPGKQMRIDGFVPVGFQSLEELAGIAALRRLREEWDQGFISVPP